MRQEVISALVDGDSASRDVLVDLTLTLLPSLGPVPGLISRNRNRGTQLDNPVRSLCELQLHTWLVEVQALAELTGQRDHTSTLYGDVSVKALRLRSHVHHDCRYAAIP